MDKIVKGHSAISRLCDSSDHRQRRDALMPEITVDRSDLMLPCHADQVSQGGDRNIFGLSVFIQCHGHNDMAVMASSSIIIWLLWPYLFGRIVAKVAL